MDTESMDSQTKELAITLIVVLMAMGGMFATAIIVGKVAVTTSNIGILSFVAVGLVAVIGTTIFQIRKYAYSKIA